MIIRYLIRSPVLLLLLLIGSGGPGPPAVDDAHARPAPVWMAEQNDRMREAMETGRDAFARLAFGEARASFRRASRIDRRDPLPHVWLGRCDLTEPPAAFAREEQLRSALEHMERALEVDSTSREGRYWKARTLTRLGGNRNQAEALDLFEGLVEEDPLYEDVMRRLLAAYMEAGSLQDYVGNLEAAARATTDDPVLTFRYADALRLNGNSGRAEAMLRGLRERYRDFAPGWVNYTLALTLFEMGEAEDGSIRYLDAITFMKYPAVARAMWEDAIWIADLTQMARFRRAGTVEEYATFLRGFWKEKDPTKTTVDNEVIAIHYDRLRVAEQNYLMAGYRAVWNNPDEQGWLHLPPTYDIEAPFNDMGLIYLRWGDPDETAWTHEIEVDNMAWKYEEKGIRQEMIFLFEQHQLGGGWRFVPTPRAGEHAAALVSMDPKFGMLLYGVDQQSLSFLVEDANQDLRVGLTGSGYIPEIEAQPLTIYNDEASFKAPGGMTRYEAYWAIPVIELVTPHTLDEGAAIVTVNISLFTADFQEVYRNSRQLRVPIGPGVGPDMISIDQEVMTVAPGYYTLALDFSDEEGNRRQIQEIATIVDSFPEGELNISDVEIAFTIEQGERGRFAKGGVTVTPLPTRVYLQNQPVLIYFGIYGLEKDEYGATRYRTSYRIDPGAGETGSLGRIRIGGRTATRQQAGGVEVVLDEESGIFNDIVKTLAISLEDSSFKTYRLRITVEDLVAGTRTVRQTFFYVNRARVMSRDKCRHRE